MLLPAIFYIAWDIYFTAANVWSFNPAYIVGVKFWGLPVEEILFFFVIPYCTMFIYVCIRTYYPLMKDRSASAVFLKLMGIFLFITGSVFFNRLYTGYTFVLTAILILLFFLFRKNVRGFHLTAFLSSFFLSLIPFLVVNGFLTALPVVNYNQSQNLGIRIYTIPVEDIIYGMLIMLMNVVGYEKIREQA